MKQSSELFDVLKSCGSVEAEEQKWRQSKPIHVGVMLRLCSSCSFVQKNKEVRFLRNGGRFR